MESVDPLIGKVLGKYPDVFGDPPHVSKLPFRPEDQKIPLKDGAEVPARPYRRLSKAEYDVLERTIPGLTKRGIIQVSSSEYRAQLLFVRKKDGSLRLCVDWRSLNNETIKDRTPLAPHSEIRERVQGKQFL